MKHIAKTVKENTSTTVKKDSLMINETHAFLNDLQLILEDKKVAATAPVFAPCTKTQCMYVLNFKTREMISMMGVEEMLGYTPEEFNYSNLVNYVHPEDTDSLAAVMHTILEYVTHHQFAGELMLSVTYRVRKKNGNYIKILRQTSIGYNKYDRQTLYHNNMLTDISFMRSGSQVEWTFEAPDFDPNKLKMYVPASTTQFFSVRELEVLELIDKGLTSQAIAKALFISKHTVDTHRRKMLQKTGCPNAIALLEFYRSHAL
jgi:DNA-binding CsgD family transcriptional regulator